jgi:hypothetical protein
VTIRSAEIRDRTLRMTGAKLRAMLHALGTTDAL